MFFRKKRIKPSDYHVSVDVTSDSKELDGMSINVKFEVADKATVRRLKAEDERRQLKFIMPSSVPSTDQLRHQIALTSSSPFFPEMDKASIGRVRVALAASFDSGESTPQLMKRLGEILDDQQTIEGIAHNESVYCYQAAVARFGKLSGAAGKEWQCVSNRTCDECNELNGKVVPISSKFHPKDKLGYPPLHNGCTCGIRIIYPDELSKLH